MEVETGVLRGAESNPYLQTFTKTILLSRKIYDYQEFKEDEETSTSNLTITPMKCLRKVGCLCPDCSLFFKSAQPPAISKITNMSQFVKASDALTRSFIYQKSQQFLQMLLKLTHEYSLLAEDTIRQQSFLSKTDRLMRPQQKNNQYVFQVLSKKQCLDALCILALGHSDNLRWRALKILITMVVHHTTSDLSSSLAISDEKIRLLSDKVYVQAYDMEHWVPYFQEVTPKTVFLPLSHQELDAIRRYCKLSNESYLRFQNQRYNKTRNTPFPENWFQYLRAEYMDFPLPKGLSLEQLEDTIFKLMSRIDCSLKEHNIVNGFFMKLSTRSPKDSKYLIEKQKILKAKADPNILAGKFETQQELVDYINSEIVRTSNCMMSAAEALTCFLLSTRVEDDIQTELDSQKTISQQYQLKKSTLSLVIREFVEDIPTYAQVRGFVCNYTFTALTQYQEDKKYPWLTRNKEAISKKVYQFFEQIKWRMKEWGIPHAIVDFGMVVKDGQIVNIVLIEFNSYGVRSGSGLFDWDKEQDYRRMLLGPFEFRTK